MGIRDLERYLSDDVEGSHGIQRHGRMALLNRDSKLRTRELEIRDWELGIHLSDDVEGGHGIQRSLLVLLQHLSGFFMD